MVKHTQTICRLLPTNCLSVFNHFVSLALKGLMFPTVLQESKPKLFEALLTSLAHEKFLRNSIFNVKAVGAQSALTNPLYTPFKTLERGCQYTTHKRE